MAIKKSVGLMLSLALSFSAALVGCQENKPAAQNKPASKEEAANASGDQGKEKVMRMSGDWRKPPEFQGNSFAAGGVGAAYEYVFEGLMRNVRLTDKVFPRLATSIEHKGNQTVVKIRSGVKWHDGKPFTSKDIWAYYMLDNGNSIMKYLTDIEIPDDTTVVFKWQQPAPFDEMKTMLIAEARQARIQYEQYKKFVDKAVELLNQAKPAAEGQKKGPLGKFTDPIKDKLDQNWNDFKASGPARPLGTGPYMVETVTASDMVLKKNPDYWDAKNVRWDKLTFKRTPDPGVGYAMLKSGQMDIFDGTPPKDILESILAANKNLVHYRMFDPATIGMLFNTAHKPFDNVKFRQAVTFALDRKKIREVGNYYGQEAEVGMTGMPQSQLKKWVDPDILGKMTKYTYDTKKAEDLLKELGWSKGSDGNWKDKEGKTPNFVIGVNGSDLPKVNSGQVAAEQLTKFGLPTKLMAVDGTVYGDNAKKEDSPYDMSMDWVDVAWGYAFPWGSINNFYNGDIGRMAHLPRVKETDRVNLNLAGPDGKQLDIWQSLLELPYLKTDKERKDLISTLAWITNENAYGVGFFQNATGTWINTKSVTNLPMASQIDKYKRDMPLPTDPEDTEYVAETNIGFAGTTVLVEPNKLAPKDK